MREEEEKVADEEAVDDIPYTYDRPDLSNKVTLRRCSTGMWKVCSSGQTHSNEVLLNSVTEKKTSNKKKAALNLVSIAKKHSEKYVLCSDRSEHGTTFPEADGSNSTDSFQPRSCESGSVINGTDQALKHSNSKKADNTTAYDSLINHKYHTRRKCSSDVVYMQT